MTVAGVTAVGVFGVNSLTALAVVAVPKVSFGASLVNDVYALIAVPAEAEPTEIAVPSVGAEPTSVTFGILNAVPALAEPTDMASPRVGAEPTVMVRISLLTDAVVAEPTAVTLGMFFVSTLMFGTENGVPRVGGSPTSVTLGMLLFVTLMLGTSVVEPPVTSELAVDVIVGMLMLVVVRLAAVPAVTVAAAPVVPVIECVCPFLLKMVFSKPW